MSIRKYSNLILLFVFSSCQVKALTLHDFESGTVYALPNDNSAKACVVFGNGIPPKQWGDGYEYTRRQLVFDGTAVVDIAKNISTGKNVSQFYFRDKTLCEDQLPIVVQQKQGLAFPDGTPKFIASTQSYGHIDEPINNGQGGMLRFELLDGRLPDCAKDDHAMGISVTYNIVFNFIGQGCWRLQGRNLSLYGVLYDHGNEITIKPRMFDLYDRAVIGMDSFKRK